MPDTWMLQRIDQIQIQIEFALAGLFLCACEWMLLCGSEWTRLLKERIRNALQARVHLQRKPTPLTTVISVAAGKTEGTYLRCSVTPECHRLIRTLHSNTGARARAHTHTHTHTHTCTHTQAHHTNTGTRKYNCIHFGINHPARG